MAVSQARLPTPPHLGGKGMERLASSPHGRRPLTSSRTLRRERGYQPQSGPSGAPPGGKVTDWRQEACAERGGGQCWTQKDLKPQSRAGVRPRLRPPRDPRWHLRALA